MPLESLAPKYHAAHHEIYLDLLERAINHPDTRNVALTGAYGSGKSSVLHELSRTLRHRKVIELSLSTLDPELAPAVQSENKAEAEISNRIQKELVKQLLYQLPPWKTPHSRFQRATAPSKWTGFKVACTAVLVVLVSWVLSVLAGWQETLVQRVNLAGWNSPLFWAALAIGPVLLAIFGWRIIAGRYTFKAGVKASALSVSLEPTSSSYFDQYLDEIMYFFQASKTEIVLIEDVDRFDDAIVFDTLRALNILANNSGQVKRRIVFVYAIRDSVLGKIGTKKNKRQEPGSDASVNTASTEEQTAIGMSRANRAKYFDVIIPIIPFVSTDNARDLMMEAMDAHMAKSPEPEGISPSLIRLAARHVADMRTIRSIRNEFEIYKDRLMTSAANPMPKINDDIVLSLVLLRVTCPDAYEGIRLSESPLDALVRRWNDLVEANIAVQTERLTDLRTQLENGNLRTTRAKQAGAQLESLRPHFLSMSAAFTADTVRFGSPLTDDDLGNPTGWQSIADGEDLSIALSGGSGYHTKSTVVKLGRQLLEGLIGMSIEPTAWRVADTTDLLAQIERAEKEIRFLRHHNWAELYPRDDLTVTAKPSERKHVIGDAINFAGLVQTYAPSALSSDLIKHGYLPRHFARYSSIFYGAVISPNAAEYISRAIEPGKPVLEYELTDEDVAQILLEQDATSDSADLFDDQSIYNLDIVNYLLTHRSKAAQHVATRLATRWEEHEQKFVSRFFQRKDSQESGELASLMASSWEQALRYVVVDAAITPETRLHLVDMVLGAINSHERSDLDQEVGSYLSEHYGKLQNLTNPQDQFRARIVMKTVADAESTIRDLTMLNQAALEASVQLSIYPVTATNLQALGGTEHVALDALRRDSEKEPIYSHFLNKLGDYLNELPKLEPAGIPILAPDDFTYVLTDVVASVSGTLLDRFVKETPVECRVLDLADIDSDSWPSLVSHERTNPTFANVHRYVDEYGVDQTLGKFVSAHGAIKDIDEAEIAERLSLAIQILKAREEIPSPDIRVKIADSLGPGVVPISEISVEDANLVGRLLEAGMLADAPETFSPDLLMRWEEFESAVIASDSFGELADATILPARHLAQLLRSKKISEETKEDILNKLNDLLLEGTAVHTNAILQALIERREILDLSRLETLQRAGAANGLLVNLIVIQSASLSVEDLRTILCSMGGDYRRVSEGGSGVVHFAADDDHQELLARLAGVTHTGAELKTTKLHGTKLQANLKRAVTNNPQG